jgi:hypothetical protein
MQLTLEDYQALLYSLRPMGARQHSDKRKHLRFDTEAQVTIVPLETGQTPQPCSITVTDVSRMGIRLARRTPMTVGQTFLLCLTTNDTSRTRPIVCIVRRVSRHARHGYVMGCEFTNANRSEVPTEDVMEGLEEFQQNRFDADAVELGMEPPRRRKKSVMKRLASLLRS